MSASFIWLSGLVRRRAGLMLPATLGISLTIALLAILGIFINSSAATMTQRALGDVAVDWQIEIANGASPVAVEKLLRDARLRDRAAREMEELKKKGVWNA